MGDLLPLSLKRWKVKRTASALNGAPSWKVTPDFNFMVTEVPSCDDCQLSARNGTSLLFASRTTSVSNRYGRTRLRPEFAAACGSITAGSEVIARTNEPPRGAA